MSTYGPPGGPAWPAPPHMAAPTPPKKKGMSTGCFVVLVLVLVFFVGIGAVVLFVGYKVSTDKDVQNMVGAIGDAAEIMAEAQNAPGTAELRALGCEQAMAIDTAKMQKIGGRFTDAGGPPVAPMKVGRMVMCQVKYATPPSCDDAAAAYLTGAAPRTDFLLTVTVHNRQTCSGVYSPDGARVTPAGTATAP